MSQEPEIDERTTIQERGLLIYLESCATEYGGLIEARRMNREEFAILKKWHESGFIKFGRIAEKDIKHGPTRLNTHWVILSSDAWYLAQEERRNRSKRLQAKITIERLGL